MNKMRGKKGAIIRDLRTRLRSLNRRTRRVLAFTLSGFLTLGLITAVPTPSRANTCTSPQTSTSGNFTIVRFTNVQTCTWTVPAGVTSVDFLVVGGGGGGGSRHSGGGGAGGLRTSVGTSGGGASAESSLTVQPGSVLSVTVGAGGAGKTGNSGGNGSKGGNSTLGTITAEGGGTQTETGGSGGGANCAVPNCSVGSGRSGQGFSGATGVQGNSPNYWAGGGGGGAGGLGGAAAAYNSSTLNARGGVGGAGLLNSITGSQVCYAAGGAGGFHYAYGQYGNSAVSGGGCGSGAIGGSTGFPSIFSNLASASEPGAANTGSGGGGGGFGPFNGNAGATEQNYNGGAGGSGVVIVRYQSPTAVSAPNSVSVTSSPLALNVTWSAPTKSAGSVTGYQVEHSTTGTAGGSWTVASSSIPAGTTSFSISGLSSSTAYYVRVAARYSSGLGPYGYPWTSKYRTTTSTRSGNNIVYASGSAGQAQTSFSRVRYVIAATQNSVNRTVDANFDRAVSGSGNLNSIANLQVPTPTNGLVIQGNVSDLTVISNTGGLVTDGHGLTGRLEHWGWNYAPEPAGRQENNRYDDYDTSWGNGSYGSFQLHNLESTSRQTVFAWNNHGGIPEIGFGNNTGIESDWTFCSGGTSTCPNPSSFSLEIFANDPVTPQVGPAVTPTFGAVTATPVGYTVQISNYDPAYSWAGTATASGSVTISGSGLVTVTGLAPSTSSTATINTTRTGYTSGSGTVSGTSSGAVFSYNFSDLNSYNFASPGTVTDLSGNSRTGTVTNGSGGATTTWTQSTGSLSFPGGSNSTGPFIDVPNILTTPFNTHGVTLDFEASFGSSRDNYERVIDFSELGAGNDALIVFRDATSSNLGIEIWNGSASGSRCTFTNAISENVLTRYTIMANGTNCQLWKDGTSVSSQSYTARVPAGITWTDNFIGKSNWSSDAQYEGSIRSLRLYSGPFTPTQIGAFDYKTITYGANGGSTTPASGITSGSIRLPAAITRNGYTFQGWYNGINYLSSTKRGDASASYTPTATETIQAGWSGNSNTVTFNSNYTGGPTATTQTITTDVQTVLTANTFTRTGYTFAGWNTAANGSGTAYANSANVTISSALNLFAQWTANSNTVTFNSNYTGGPTATTQSITTDSATALTANTFTRSGYTFAGWNTAANGSGTTYTNSQSVTLSAPLNLFAVWYRISITTQPVGKASGTTLQTQPVVRIEDGNGATVASDSTTSVTVAISSGAGGTLGGTQTLRVTNGVATFTNLTLSGTVGTNYVLSFTSSPSYTAATSQNVTVTPGAVSATNSTITPTTATLFADGVSTQKFTITLKDAQGNTFTSTNDTVTFARSNSLGTFGTTINTAPGVYEGTYTSGTSPGTDTITVTANTVALSTQPVITLNPGIPSTATSTVTAASTSLTANGSSTSVVTIRLKDSSGNNIPRGGAAVTIRVSSGTGSIGSVTDNSDGTYSATYTSSTTAGTATLVAAISGSDITDTETITLNPGTATKLGVTLQPSITNASGAVLSTQPRIAIQDANGNTVTTAAATTITVGLVGSNGTLGGTQTASTSSGVAVFSGLTLAGLTSNTYRLSFTGGGLTGVNSDLISITPGAASVSTSTVTASSNSIVANGTSTSTITVQLKDAQGNNLTAAGGTVVVSKSSGGGTVSATTNNNNGTYTATLTSPTTVGTAVIQATVGGSTITDTESISLVAGPATKIAITRAPVTGANASNFSTQPQITLQDANSNTVILNSSSTVTVTLQSGANGTLSGTNQVTFVNGVAEFTNLALTGRTATNYVLRFTADSFTVDSGNLTLTPGTASTATSTVVATDSTLTATGLTSTTITIRLKDAQTNALTASGGTVTVSVASGGGSLSAVTNNNNGTYTATYTSGTTAGTAVINASLGGSAISDTESITLVHGVAAKIRITQQPTGTASGTALGTQPIVEITDINNNRVVADNSTVVTVAISAGTGGNLGGTRTATAATGLVEFTNLTLSGLVGQSYKLSLSSGSLTAAESSVMSVTPGAAATTTSTISASSSSITANGSSTSTITVQLKDAQGNSLTSGGNSVAIRVSAGTGGIGSTTDVGNGTYTTTFTSSTTAGTSTIRATLGGSDITATQNIALTPGVANKLAVSVQPSSSNASGAVLSTQPRIAIQDAFGNTVTSDSGRSITVGLIGNGGSITGTQTISTSSGIAIFSGITLAGLISENYVLSFSANGLTGINSDPISITPGTASAATSTVVASTNSIVADGATTSTITVQLKDAQGNLLTAAGGTVVVSKASGGGTVATTTNNNNGTYTATFTSPTTVGATVIQATVGGNTITDTETITLRHGVANKLVITQAPVAGASSSLLTTQPRVTLQDVNGNTITSNSVDTVTVAISSGANGNLTGTKTLVLSSGVAAFTDLNLAGRTGTNYVLRFESGLFSTTSANIQVAAGAASTVTSNVAVSSNSLTANGTSTSTITVTLRDSESNQIAAGGQTVALSVTSGFGSIGTVTDNSNGTYTATYTSGTTVGTATISATLNTAAISETKTITLVHGPATKVTITQQPATGASGTNLATQPKVVLRDANNNIATSDTSSTVTVAITSGSNGSLTGTKTVTVVAGEAVFTDLSFAGIVATDYKLRFSSGSLTVADSNNLRVTPGVAVVGTSTVTASSSSITANGVSTSTITVQLKDAEGNSLTVGGNTVAIRVSAGTGNVGSTTDAGNGTYTTTFTSSTTAGTSTIRATLGGTDITATQNIALTPGAASKLGILTEPPNTTSSGVVLATQPRIAVQDAFGNTVTSDSGRSVLIGVVGNDGSVGGTTTRTSASGIVTFSGISLAGLTSNGYRLSFTTSGLTGVNSQIINLTPGAASTATSVVSASTTSIVANGSTTSTITVTLKDAQGNLLVATGGTVLVSKVSGNGSLTTTTDNGNGTYTATFTSPTAVGTTVIQATVGGSTITDTESITLVHGDATQIKITQTPITGANASTFTRQPKITLFDANDNVVTSNSSGAVEVALFSGDNGALSGTTQATLTNGVASFTNLAITGRTSTDYVLRFTSGSFTVDSASLTLTPGVASASTSTVVISDSTLIANGSATATVTVRLRDAQTNSLVASGGTVAITVATGGGSISAVTNNNDGTYTATYTSGTVVGTRTISASVNSESLTDTEQVTLVPGPATKLRITQQPTGTSSGTALGTQPIVEITDAFNNRVTGDSSTQVTAAISSGTGGTLGGTRTVTAALGLATFTDVTLAGLVSQSYKLTFSSGSLTVIESSAISVTPGVAVASTSTISASSTSITANGSTTSVITVQLKDAQGNSLTTSGGSVGMRIASGTGTLDSVSNVGNGTYTSTYTSSQVTGAIEIRASLGDVELTEIQNLTLTPGAATKLAIYQAPISQRSGEVLSTQPKISVQDQFGNVVTGDSGRVVTVAITAGNGGSLDGTLTASTVNGIATFTNVVLAGITTSNYVLSFTTPNLTSVNSGVLTVSSGSAQVTTSTFGVSASSIVANGVTTSVVTVTIRDAKENALTASAGTVEMFVTAGHQGTIGNVLNNGDGTYTATYTSGTLVSNSTITAKLNGVALTQSATISLTAGPATQLAIATQPVGSASATALSQQPVIHLLDAFGNHAIQDSTTSVTAAINSGSFGSLSGTTIKQASQGVVTFTDLSLAGRVSENYKLRFSSGSLVVADSNNVTVTPGAPSTATSLVSSAVTSLVAETTNTTTVTITLKDAQGNLLTTGGATVGLAVSPVTSGFTDLGNVGSVTDRSNGTYTATYTAGTRVQSVRFSATLGGAAITDTSQLSLTHGAAYQIAVQTNPVGGASGSQLTTQPVVIVQDRHGNTVTSDNGTVITAALGGFQNTGTLSGTRTAVTSNGQAAFAGIVMSGRINTQYVLAFTSSGLVAVNSANYTISQGPTNVTNSAIETDAAAIVANGTSTTVITVSIKDTEGNVVAASAGTVALTVAQGTGSLSTVVDNNNGTYTSTFTAGTVSGTAQIIGTLNGSALGGSASIILTSGPAENAQILIAPGSSASGALLNPQPQIVIKDVNGNTVTSDSSTVVTLSLKSGDSGTLAGTLTATASSGIAQFSNVTLSGLVGTNYVLEFDPNTSGVRSIDSAAVNLTPGTPTQLVLTTPAATANSGQAFLSQPVLTAKDAQGNVATNFTADVTASVSGATLQGSITKSLSNGVATFTDLGMFGTANASYQVTYATTALNLSANQSLLLNPGSANNLLIVSQPTTEMNGRAFVTQPVIQIRDAQNNAIVTNTPVSVVASINTGSGTLSGATSVATNSTGLATFTDLMVTGNTGSYTLTFAVVGLSIDSNSFALTPGDQTITRSTFGSTALPNGTYTPTANAYSGLSVAISIASTSATVCSIDQLGKVTFLKMGDCAIKYNQTGNTHWSAAPELVETLSVGRLTQTTTFAAIDDQPFGGTDVALTASAQSGLLVTFAVTSASTICVLNTATTVQIVGLGTCTVVASQSGDEVWAPASDVTRSFVIGTVRPATPTVSSVSAGNTQATISWNPPTHNGGSQILGYRVTSQPDGLTCSTTNSTDSSCIVTGLTNGTEYTFVVQALNAIGYSNASTASPEVTPATTADAVVGLTLTSTNKKLTANWIMPEQLGGGNFVRFEMFIRETGGNYGDAFTSNDANLTTFDFTKLDPNDNTNVSDLINGESYDVKIVIITDAIMAGDQSVTVLAGNSTEATQVPADVASAPTNATILTTDGTQASVSWIASSSNGGAVITAYSVTATANNVAVTCVMQLQLDTSCEISSLTPGQVINVSIQAVNRIGNSVAATASMKLPTPPAPPTMNAATAGSGFIQVTWAVPASDGGMALTGYVAKAMVRGTNQVVAECTTIGTSCDLMVSGTEFDFDFAVWSMNRVGMSDSSNMLSPKRPTVSPTPTPSPSGPRTRSSGTTNAGAAVAIFDTRRPVFMPNGELPELNVGTTMAWQNGQLVQVNLVSAGTSALQLSAAGGVVLQMQTLHVSGQPMDVAANGMLQVFHNRSIRIAGSGFAPNSMATVWLFSEPVKLGEIQTDANGGFAELFAINTSIPLGDHTIQINGQHTDGSVRTVAMGVSIFGEDFAPEEVVTDASGPSDSDSNQALGVIGAVGLAFIGGIGVGILMLSQRKRKS